MFRAAASRLSFSEMHAHGGYCINLFSARARFILLHTRTRKMNSFGSAFLGHLVECLITRGNSIRGKKRADYRGTQRSSL